MRRRGRPQPVHPKRKASPRLPTRRPLESPTSHLWQIPVQVLAEMLADSWWGRLQPVDPSKARTLPLCVLHRIHQVAWSSVQIECNSQSLVESRHCSGRQLPTPAQQPLLVEYPHLLSKNYRIGVQPSFRRLHEHVTGIDSSALSVGGAWGGAHDGTPFIDRIATDNHHGPCPPLLRSFHRV